MDLGDHRQRFEGGGIVGAGGEQAPAIVGEPRVVAEARAQRQAFAHEGRIARRWVGLDHGADEILAELERIAAG